MYYSLTFIPYVKEVGQRAQPPYSLTTDRNTWEHWRIVPTSRPTFAPPSPNTNLVTISGANGSEDLSQVLTGYPTYGNRTGSFEFVVMNDFRHWQEAYTDIMTTVHNKKLICIYEEDPEYYYVGRWSVQNWTPGESNSKITLNYTLDPYKWRIYDSDGAWLWNPFNFNIGIVPNRDGNDEGDFNTSVTVDPENYPIGGTKFKTLLKSNSDDFIGEETETTFGTGYFDAMSSISEIIGNAPICPVFTVKPRAGESSVNVLIHFENPELPEAFSSVDIPVTTTIEKQEIPEIVITNYTGVNGVTISVQGDGVVSFVYRIGRF